MLHFTEKKAYIDLRDVDLQGGLRMFSNRMTIHEHQLRDLQPTVLSGQHWTAVHTGDEYHIAPLSKQAIRFATLVAEDQLRDSLGHQAARELIATYGPEALYQVPQALLIA